MHEKSISKYIKGHFRQVWEVPLLLRLAPPLNRVLKIVMGRGSDISLIFVAGRSRPRFVVSRASKGRSLFNSPYGLFPMFLFSILVWIGRIARLCNRRYCQGNTSVIRPTAPWRHVYNLILSHPPLPSL